MRVDYALSARLAEAVAKIRAGKPAAETETESGERCRNTYLAFLAMPHLVAADAVYVEGWVVALGSGLVFEHGWIEQGDEIVDPARWEEDLAYFSGPRFTAGEVCGIRVETAGAEADEFPLVRRIGGWSGLEDAEHRRAYEESLAFAESMGDGAPQNHPAPDAG